MNLIVGQVLWYQPNDRRRKGYEVTINRVGRKWAYCHGRFGRVDRETPGRCYLSRDDYDKQQAIDFEWHRLFYSWKRPYNAPLDVTLEDIVAARKLLRLDP